MIRQEIQVSSQSGIDISDTSESAHAETVDIVGIEIQYADPLKSLVLMNLMTWEWKSWDLLFNFLHELLLNEALPNYYGKLKSKNRILYPNKKVNYLNYSIKHNEYQRGIINLKNVKWMDPINEWRQQGRL